jgi:hypothetical protein
MNADPKTPELQGEGGDDAARRYNDATKRFGKSRPLPEVARNAAPKMPAQAQELQQAEQDGLQHAKAVGAQVQRPGSPSRPSGAAKRVPKASVEDEAADPVGDGHSDADYAQQMPPPDHPNPAPDRKEPAGDIDLPQSPGDDEQTLNPAHPHRSITHRRRDATNAS